MFRISSKRWAGLGKFVEESGELNEIIGKLVATHGGKVGPLGDKDYWDGRDLVAEFEDEVADVLAVLSFIIDHNPQLNKSRIINRAGTKYARFLGWRKEKLG